MVKEQRLRRTFPLAGGNFGGLSFVPLLLLTIFVLSSIGKLEAQDANAVDTEVFEEVDVYSSQLDKDEKYKDIFELTEENFEESVIECEDPWIVIFHQGRLTLDWKKMAVELRGIVWVGMINIEEEPFVDDMDLPSSMEDESVFARIYPFGGERVKTSKAGWNHTNDPQTAKAIAVNTIPDICPIMQAMGKDFNEFLKLVYEESSEEGEAMKQFIHAAFFPGAGWPTFPAFFLSESEGLLHPLFRAVALRFKGYFSFAHLQGVSPSFLSQAGLLPYIPGIVILQPFVKGQNRDGGTIDKVTFYGLSYDRDSMGGLDYPRILQYLFAVNKNLREKLPEENGSHDLDVLNMEDILELEGQRFDLFVYTDAKKVPMKNDIKKYFEKKDEL